jgi:membrane-associated protein
MGSLQLEVAMPLLVLAAFLGDNSNYWIGRLLGLRLLERASPRLIRHEHLAKTRAFYAKHGGKTVIFARFLPIIRTFAPFVAGIGTMNYRHYVMFSVIGGMSWIASLTLAGYFFGNIPFIKNNLTLMILLIVVVSFIPAIREFIKHRRNQKHSG